MDFRLSINYKLCGFRFESKANISRFFFQHNLRSLCLDNNRLVELQPGVFDGLTSLQTLSLNDNRLEELPV